MYQLTQKVYNKVGSDYDNLEFIGHVTKKVLNVELPNPEEKVVCASLCTVGYSSFELIVKKGVDPQRPTPEQIHSYFISSPRSGSYRDPLPLSEKAEY